MSIELSEYSSNLLEKEEIERLKSLINDMSFIIGCLRGSLIGFEDSLCEKQMDSLAKIDKKIDLLFYSHQFKCQDIT